MPSWFHHLKYNYLRMSSLKIIHLKVPIFRYFHNSEMGITGTLANIKKRFHHNHAGKDAKVGTSI